MPLSVGYGEGSLYEYPKSISKKTFIKFFASLKGALVLLDEPEVHLHPHAVIVLVDKLRELVGKEGQIWIATHSVSLLSNLKNNEIWIMEKGEAKAPNINQVNHALEALLGNEDNVEKMREVLQSPVHFVATKFLSECLLNPSVVQYSEKDPQLWQIAELIKTKKESSEPIKLLDVGAGNGRLGILIENMKKELGLDIEYHAVELQKKLRDELNNNLSRFDSESKVYNTTESIPTDLNDAFDIVVLCNVVHEIRATKWVSEFKEILKRLSGDGSLIIMEDQFLPTGELPNDIGYLIPNPHEFKIMFNMTDEPMPTFHFDEKYKDRLMCLAIPRNNIKMIDRKTVKDAVSSIQRRMSGEIETLRNAPSQKDARIGRLYAHYTQMFCNAFMALKELK